MPSLLGLDLLVPRGHVGKKHRPKQTFCMMRSTSSHLGSIPSSHLSSSATPRSTCGTFKFLAYSSAHLRSGDGMHEKVVSRGREISPALQGLGWVQGGDEPLRVARQSSTRSSREGSVSGTRLRTIGSSLESCYYLFFPCRAASLSAAAPALPRPAAPLLAAGRQRVAGAAPWYHAAPTPPGIQTCSRHGLKSGCQAPAVANNARDHTSRHAPPYMQGSTAGGGWPGQHHGAMPPP